MHSDDLAESLSVQEGSSSYTALNGTAAAPEQPTTDGVRRLQYGVMARRRYPRWPRSWVWMKFCYRRRSRLPIDSEAPSARYVSRSASRARPRAPPLGESERLRRRERGRISADIVSAWLGAHADGADDSTDSVGGSSVASDHDATGAEVHAVQGVEHRRHHPSTRCMGNRRSLPTRHRRQHPSVVQPSYPRKLHRRGRDKAPSGHHAERPSQWWTV